MLLETPVRLTDTCGIRLRVLGALSAADRCKGRRHYATLQGCFFDMDRSDQASIRKLAAILVADVVGFSRMMAADEAATLAALRAMRKEVCDPLIAEFGGRTVATAGDGLLAEFPSAVSAMRCAMEIQSRMQSQATGLQLRIGVNVGDVVVEGEDILGDGVNLAARLEAAAEPGGVAFSGTLHEHLLGRIEAEFRDGGNQTLKNIDREIRVWRWSPAIARAARTNALRQRVDRPSIAILAFNNMSGDPDQEYLADGIVESITAALSRIRSFFVIARNSSFTFKGRAANVREIGRELGVAYVLEGSVQRAANRVRITVQLVETEGGAHLWAERYDGSLEDIFDLQDRITEQVAGALQPSIRLAEIDRVRRKRPQELGAYDFAMRGMRHVWALEKDEADKALDLLDKALAMDPDYQLALVLAAWCHAQRAIYNWTVDREASIAEALRLAGRAMRDSEDDPLALTVLGAVHTIAGNLETARRILERAITLDPNSAWAWSRLGWLDAYSGRVEDAETNLRRSLRLSPLDPLNFNNFAGLAAARAGAGDWASAVEYFERALHERPGALWIRRALTACLMGAGREDEARVMAARLLKDQPDFTITRYLEATPLRPALKAQFARFLRGVGLPE